MKRPLILLGIALLNTIIGISYSLVINLKPGTRRSYKTNNKTFNLSDTDKGITFLIKDATKDGHERISLEYVITTKKGIPSDHMMGRPVIYINGKRISSSSSYSYKKIGKNKYMGLINIMPEKELPDY
ncbi:hypothetical protein [Peribacillus sp. SCS-37]|uniref:hypothetical protein n=1 Tax=Paraperibacillus esterisolvens TaxID=3115296 RepID=UPI003906A1E0